MKTTVDLPADLMVRAKVAAARRRWSLRRLFEVALRRELAAPSRPRPPKPMKWTVSSEPLPPDLDLGNREAMHQWLARQR